MKKLMSFAVLGLVLSTTPASALSVQRYDCSSIQDYITNNGSTLVDLSKIVIQLVGGIVGGPVTAVVEGLATALGGITAPVARAPQSVVAAASHLVCLDVTL